MRGARFALWALLPLAGLLIGVGSASAQSGAYTCTGGAIPVGSYDSLTITGACAVPAGLVAVNGGLTIAPGASLDASTAGADLMVAGNVQIGSGATLVLNCSPASSGCASQGDTINGNLTADQPANLMIYQSTVNGGITVNGGSGSIFSLQDSTVNGSVAIAGVNVTTFDVSRNRIQGNLTLSGDAVGSAAPLVDGNVINGNLACTGNSPAPSNLVGGVTAVANTINGNATDQCSAL